jgi:Peptidase_C39 like family
MSITFGTRIKMTACRTALATIVGAAVLAGSIGLAGTASAELYGDPEAAAQYWQPQNYDNCALMAVADVVGQLTGEMVSEDEIIELAEETPSEAHPGSIYIAPSDTANPNTGLGTNPADIVVLLAQFDIDAVITDEQLEAQSGGAPTGMHALAGYLDEGHKVIVGVNAETLWNIDGDRTYADHAVVVTGIDTTEQVVHLNDSGIEDGRDEQVPIETFAAAWAASDNTMVVTVETS